MDEEEQQQQSDSKISVSSFFERVDSVEKVASSALSKANANFGIINAQKTLINTLNLSIEALETKVRDIANYIIIEKKITRDEESDRLVEERDKEQKNITAERLMGLKGDQGVQGEPGAPAPEEGGGGGGGILGTLLKLGIGVFAIKFLWPALLPLAGGLLKGALAKFAMFAIGGLGTLLKGLIVGTLGGIGIFGLGKFFTNWGNSTEDGFKKAGESASKAVNDFSFNKDGKVDGPDSLNLGGGTESNENILEGDESMRETLTEKDLMVTPGTRINEYGAEGGGKPSSGDLSMFDEEDSENIEEKPESDINSMENRKERARKSLEYYTEKYNNTTNDRKKNLYMRKINEAEKFLGVGKFDPNVTGIKPNAKIEADDIGNILNPEEVMPDKQDNTIDSLSFSEDIGIGDSQFLSELVNVDPTGNLNNSQNKGQIVNTPYNLPNTTETTVKFTDMKVPFLKSLSNQYLSISGKTIPPEYYRAFK